MAWNLIIRGVEVNIEIWAVLLVVLFYLDAFSSLKNEVKKFQLKKDFPITLIAIAASLGVLLILVSLLIHELSHAVGFLFFNLKVKEIGISFFGAWVTPEGKVTNFPLQFAAVFVLGPLANIVLASFLDLLIWHWQGSLLKGTLLYVVRLNWFLAMISLLPVVFFDGGGAVRGLLIHFFGAEKGPLFSIMVSSLTLMVLVVWGLRRVYKEVSRKETPQS